MVVVSVSVASEQSRTLLQVVHIFVRCRYITGVPSQTQTRNDCGRATPPRNHSDPVPVMAHLLYTDTVQKYESEICTALLCYFIIFQASNLHNVQDLF